MDSELGARRLVSLVVGCVLMLSAGTIYAFSLYSLRLQEVLSLSQGQLLAAGSSLQFGLYFASFGAALERAHAEAAADRTLAATPPASCSTAWASPSARWSRR